MKKLLFTGLFISLMLAQLPALAHKEWVHQYMVKQSYLFLEQQIGSIPVLRDAVGLQFHGTGDGRWPFNNPYPIGVGAWREDLDDPVYGYTLSANTSTPSITHFWDADHWDENHESMALNVVGTSGAPNAWEKARVYLFCQDRNGWHDITIPYLMPGNGLRNYIITYNSLPELYKGNYFLEAVTYPDGSNRLNAYHSPRFDLEFGHQVALQILGRVAHLLGDMSVPAHAHSHPHPCPLGKPDYYENNMGNVYWSNNSPLKCEDDPGGSYRAEQWSATTAAQQGGLLNDMYCEAGDRAKMKYLFYTLNQLADFFPSGVNPSQVSDPTGPILNSQIFMPGDQYLNNGPNHRFIQARYAALGGSRTSINHIDIANETFNYSIRAVATLFQWFAFEAGITEDINNKKLSSSSTQICSINTAMDFFASVNDQVAWSIVPTSAALGVAWYNTSPQRYTVMPDPAYNGVVTVKAEYYLNDGCFSGPRTLTRDVWAGPRWADFTTRPATSLVCPGYPLDLAAGVWRSDLGGPFTYQWSSTATTFRNPGNSATCSFIAPRQFDNVFTVTCVITDGCQQQATIEQEFTTANPYIRRGSGSSIVTDCDNNNPNGPFGTNSFAATAEPVRSGAELELFPNPSNTGFEIVVTPSLRKQAATDLPSMVTYTLRDNLGRTRTSGTGSGRSLHIDTHDLPAGIYSLTCTASGQTFHKRVEVLH